MQELTDTYFATSEQHKDVTPARQNKVEADKKTLLGFLQDMNPFQDDTSVRNIASGVTASKELTSNRANMAKDVGCKILGNVHDCAKCCRSHIQEVGDSGDDVRKALSSN